MKGGVLMERVCPACNKLIAQHMSCSVCGRAMEDMGRAQEIFQDDYTANMPINDGFNYCVHVFRCEDCENSKNVQVNKIVL
jgi:hypothetical protein